MCLCLCAIVILFSNFITSTEINLSNYVQHCCFGVRLSAFHGERFAYNSHNMDISFILCSLKKKKTKKIALILSSDVPGARLLLLLLLLFMDSGHICVVWLKMDIFHFVGINRGEPVPTAAISY